VLEAAAPERPPLVELVCLDCGRSNAQLKHDPLGCSGMSEFQPTLLTRLPDSLVGEIVAFGIGFDGNLYVVLAQKPLDYSIEQPGWAVFPKTRPDAPQSYRVLGYDGRTADCIVDFVAREEKYNIHFVQPLFDGFLLACARSHWRSELDIEHNGRLYSRTGQLERELILGDGIEDLQVTARDRIWAGYFDEGVFGNFGWKQPLGASGLVAWDSAGTVMYEFAPPPGLDAMDWCYAINAPSDSDLWCFCATNFPLVHIHESQVVGSWQLPVTASDAFAISDTGALLRGGYNESHTYHLCTFAPDTLRLAATFSLVSGARDPISADRVVGRGDRLFLLAGRDIYRVSVSDVAGSA